MIRRLAPFIVFAVLICILLWPAVLGGRVLMPGAMLAKMSPWNASAGESGDAYWNALTWDAAAYFYPSRALLGRAIRSGELPLWNPYQLCGTPFLANAQSAVLYPPNLLFAVLPTSLAFNLLAFLHLLAAGAFTYIFLRGIGLSRMASTFGGVAFMLSGYAVVWLELPGFLSVGVWLPLALHFTRIAHEKRTLIHAALAGVAIALSLVGGHPQIAFYCVLAVGLYWIYLSVTSWRLDAIWVSFWLACVTFGIGFALAAPQLFSSFELAALSHRGGTVPTAAGYAAYSTLAMPSWRTIALMIPDFFGNPAKGGVWIPGEYAEYCGYVGVITLMLVPLGFAGKGKHIRQSCFFALLAALALAMALGADINKLLYFHIPGFAHSGSPARVLFLFMFSVAVLGARGLDHILTGTGGKRPWTVVGALVSALCILGICIALLRWVFGQMAIEIPEAKLLDAVMPLIRIFAIFLLAGLFLGMLILTGKLSRELGGALMIGILAADLIAFGMGYNPTSVPSEIYPPTRLTSFLAANSDYSRIMPLNDSWSIWRFPKSVLPPNSATVYGLYDVQGYDSLYPVRYKKLLDAAAGRDSCPPENGNMVFARNYSSPVYDSLCVRWIISRERLSRRDEQIDGCYVHRNANALPRAFIVHVIDYVEDDEALRRIVLGEGNLSTMALVNPRDSESANPWKLISLPGKTNIPTKDRVEITSLTCNKIAMKVEAREAGVLVLIDQYYPGWKALVDGKKQAVVGADYAFKAIPVSAGTHKVVFRYWPPSFERGLRYAKMALLVLAGLTIFAVVRYFGERERSEAESEEFDEGD